MALKHVQSKGRVSIIMIQNFTIQKRQSVIRIVYGVMFIIFGIVLLAVNPIEIFTNWYLGVREGSLVFRMWEDPTYKLYNEVYIFNYTNVPEYLSGEAKALTVNEIGPFRYQEMRTNENLTIDRERGVMTMKPKTILKFLPEASIADPKDVKIFVPNIALLAISTLIANQLGYFANVGAYYSMNAIGSKLFLNMTAQEYLWGYRDTIVDIASKLLPGWIDFGEIGVMDRFYAQKGRMIEVELRDPKKRFSINLWDDSPGLKEQGYTDMNTSVPCNRIQGSYEALMMSPGIKKDQIIPIFRKQACRVYPFEFREEFLTDFGVTYYRFALQDSAFNSSSAYACQCSKDCLPDGFIDISNCFYGFPIVLSKPHFMDVNPAHSSHIEGLKPVKEKHESIIDLEPTYGIPLTLASRVQVNIAVKTSSGNPITKPLKDKIIPLLWVSLYCTGPPPVVVRLLRLRFVIAPPLVLTLEILLLVVGIFLGAQGAYRIRKPRYTIVQGHEPLVPKKRNKRIVRNYSENMVFNDDELEKQAVTLLGLKNEDTPTLLFPDT